MSTMTDTAKIAIRVYAHRQRIRPAALARRAGLSKNSLARMGDDDWDPAASTLSAVENLIPEGFDFSETEHDEALRWLRRGGECSH